MLRVLACAAVFLSASPSFAQSIDAPAASDGAAVRGDDQRDGAAPTTRRDRFVISRDECGASRYAHLVGRVTTGPESISLPKDADVFSGYRLAPTTLEYVPSRLNIVIDHAGRVISVNCS
jgi:hypothetical protein